MSFGVRTLAVAGGVWLCAVTLAVAQPSADPPPPPAAAAPAPADAEDPFGEAVTLEARSIVYLKGSGSWNTAFETLLDAYRSLHAFLDKQGIKPAGRAMMIYTAASDTGFSFHAAVPVAGEIKDPPKGDIEIGQSPAGRALKFTHRGTYDAMDTTYEAITNHLDAKQLEARELFIEEYRTDLLTTPEDKLVIDILVPLK